jgi:hypothetical protein
MSKKSKKSKPKKIESVETVETVEKVDVLKLSKSEKAHLLKEAKDKLRQKLVEARFWQSLAGIERVTINGYKINFGNGDLKGLACDGLTTP